MKANWVRKAIAALFGPKKNGFVNTKQAEAAQQPPAFLLKSEHPQGVADEWAGIPEQRRREVRASMAVALMSAETLTPRQAYDILREQESQLLQRKSENEAKRAKYSADYLKRHKVKVRDYAWGAIFEGSKSALKAAGVLPREGKAGKHYWLPLTFSIAENHGPHWSAELSPDREEEGRFCVMVEFGMDERDVSERTQKALAELEGDAPNLRMARMLVRAIPPEPLSVALPQAIMSSKA